MATPRRRLVRALPAVIVDAHHNQRRAQTLRNRLARERESFDRWMKRLRRAFRAMEKSQQRIDRIERQLGPLEDN